MQYRITALWGGSIGATDGDIGTVKDVYFDDERWVVRYFVVETGSWLAGREVLIPLELVRGSIAADKVIPVALTREQVKTSPPVDTAQPVSRHYEAAHAAHFGTARYWETPGSWAAGPFGHMFGTYRSGADTPHDEMDEIAQAERERAEQSHLRSSAEVIGYEVVGSDGSIGRVDDFLVEGDDWRITHLVVDTRTWLPGGQVIVPPQAVEHVSWSARSVRLAMTREEARNSPDLR